MVISIAAYHDFQSGAHQMIKDYDEIAALTLFTNSGFILEHMVPERAGKMAKDVETIFGSNMNEAADSVNEITANIQSVTNTLVKNTENATELTDASDIGRTGLSVIALGFCVIFSFFVFILQFVKVDFLHTGFVQDNAAFVAFVRGIHVVVDEVGCAAFFAVDLPFWNFKTFSVNDRRFYFFTHAVSPFY